MRSCMLAVSRKRKRFLLDYAGGLQNAAWNFILRRPRSFTAKTMIVVTRMNTHRSISWATRFVLVEPRTGMASCSSAFFPV